MTSQQWSPSTMWQHSRSEFCIPFHRSCSFFPFWLAMTCPVCCHPLVAFPVSVHTVHVYIRESLWRLASEQDTVVGMSSEIREGKDIPADIRLLACVWVCARIPSTLVTAAVQCCGDSPSSANKERQYGNVATLCQQGTFSSALVYFFSFNWKERKTEYTKGHHKVTWVLTIHESHKLTDIACWAW